MSSNNKKEKVVVKLNGSSYKLTNGRWCGTNGIIPPIAIENQLDDAVIDELDRKELFRKAEKLKDDEKYQKAIRFYEVFIEDLEKDKLRYAMSSLATCYRKSGRQDKVIALATKIKNKHGPDFLTAAFMTIVGWAYWDLGDMISARKCANIALKKSNGKASQPLQHLYYKIKE